MLVGAKDIRSTLRAHLNFFRIHLICFLVIPLVAAAVFYAANGDDFVKFVDALFISFSAATCTGLQSLDLSGLTGFQQALLVILTSFGNIVVVSWIMVFVRRQYFTRQFKIIISRELSKRKKAIEEDKEKGGRSLMRRLSGSLTIATPEPHHERNGFRRLYEDGLRLTKRSGPVSDKHKRSKKKLRLDMIQRAEANPQPVNPEGSVETEVEMPDVHPSKKIPSSKPITSEKLNSEVLASEDPTEKDNKKGPEVQFDVPGDRSQMRLRRVEGDIEVVDRYTPIVSPLSRASSARGSTRSKIEIPESSKDGGFGGFPYPHELILRLIHRLFPKLAQPSSYKDDASMSPTHLESKKLDYFTFEAIVGRNSRFLVLSEDEIEELGGVEYRALTALLWIVPLYWLGLLIIGFAIVAPYMSMRKWSTDFSPPALHKDLNPSWFSLFQLVSSFTDTGLSLVDQSMVPFQEAYPLVFVMTILICAGNTAYPCFLRFFIWSIYKLTPKESRLSETLHFLLDHPRRCFVYLFPSYQTWCLFAVVLILNFSDLFFFIVLDIGNAAIDAIPVGVRFAIGLLQATSVRTGGFAVVSLADIAPGVQVCFLIMMYISSYPIALGVRSTNVYEERSMGILSEEDSDTELPSPSTYGRGGSGSKLQDVGRYLGFHMRRQLSFDMWWLASALFLVCIIERDKIMNTTDFAFVNIFSILFELVSAYGTVGLSTGVPNASYALTGVLSPLSKLVIILVMLRGRHRGLPVAIDRAIMLPYDLELDSRLDEKERERSRGSKGGEIE